MGIPTFPASNRIDTSGHRGTGSGLGGLYGTSKAADDFPNSSRMSSDWKQARARCVVSIRGAQERQITTKAKGMAQKGLRIQERLTAEPGESFQGTNAGRGR